MLTPPLRLFSIRLFRTVALDPAATQSADVVPAGASLIRDALSVNSANRPTWIALPVENPLSPSRIVRRSS